jgi:hypothetical protein
LLKNFGFAVNFFAKPNFIFAKATLLSHLSRSWEKLILEIPIFLKKGIDKQAMI